MGRTRLAPLLAGTLLLFSWGFAHAQTSTGAVTLQWTAPGDDGMTGTAARYDLRYSLYPINGLNFAFANGVQGLPLPAPPGTLQKVTVYGLLPGLRYYFALKTSDEKLNWSDISNVLVYAQTVTGVDPDAPRVMFSSPIPNPARHSTRFTFSLPKRSHVSIRIFDIQGRVIRPLVETDREPGAEFVTWDLRDQFGQPVQAGVYLARAVIGETTIVRRVLVER